MSYDGEQKSWRRVDWVLLGAVAAWAVAVRLAFLAAAAGHAYYVTPVMDMLYHDAWARRIAAGDFWGGSEPFFRAPLYPYFLGLLYRLGGGSILFARVVQAFVGGVSAALCFLLGREVFDRRVGAVAALALGTAWTAIFYDVELLLVVLEVPLGLAFVYFVVKASKSLRVGWAAAAGVALGLGAITRPNLLAVAVFIWIAFFVVRSGRRLPWRRIVTSLVVLYAVGGAFVAAVAVRNYAVAREPVLISWQGGVNLWIGNNPEADGMTAVVPGTYGDWWRGYYESIRMAEDAAGRALRHSEVDRYYLGRVLKFMREDPGGFLKLLGRKTYFYTNAYEVANNFDLYYLKKQFWLLRCDPVSLYVILPFAFFGMIACARRRRSAPLYIYVVVYSATVVLFFVNGRFRMPAVPYLCIFAAAAFFYFWDNLGRWRGRGLALRVAGLAALFVYCDADPFGVGGQSSFEAQGRYMMGTIHLARGELDAAQREYEAALASNRKAAGPNALNDLGIIAARRGDTERAERYFRLAVAADPEYSKGWNNIGNIRARDGDAEGARKYYERAIAVDPEDARAYYFYGKLLLKEGDAAGAAEKFERAVHYQPNFAEAWLELGNIYRRRGDLARARGCFEKVVYYEPSAAYGRRALGEVLHQLGDYAGVERQYRLVLASHEDARARYNLACALARRGRGDEAMAELKRAVELAPERYRKMAAADGDLASLRGRGDFERLVVR